MSLKTDLQAAASSKYLDDHGNWRIFVIDHINFIRNKSRTVYPDGTIMQRYRYDVTGYLRYNTVPTELVWIFLLINDLGSELEFTESLTYYLPDQSYIDDLYHSYITTSKDA